MSTTSVDRTVRGLVNGCGGGGMTDSRHDYYRALSERLHKASAEREDAAEPEEKP
jgi:hypothetical protein